MIIAVVLALIINIIIYLVFEVKIIKQRQYNLAVQNQLEALNNHNQLINQFNLRVDKLQHKIKLINQLAAQRENSLNFVKSINQVIPNNIYLNQLTWQINSASFAGITVNPVQLTNFLDRLRDEKGIFREPVLKSNQAQDGINYNFLISVTIESNLSYRE